MSKVNPHTFLRSIGHRRNDFKRQLISTVSHTAFLKGVGMKHFLTSSLALCSLRQAQGRLLLFVLFVSLLVPSLAFAQYGLKETATGAGVYKEGVTLQGRIGTFTGALLSLVGVLFFLLALYGGILWMTAKGEEAQATKAKGIIVDAVIGLAIVSAAYIITRFVFQAVK